MDHHYDIAIIGMGCAGGHIALQLLEKAPHLKVAILDNYGETAQEKTWSFWEKGASKWDEIAFASWDQTTFHTGKKELRLDLSPYRYKSVKNVDFIAFAKAKLQPQPNFSLLPYEVINTKTDGNRVVVEHTKGSLTTDIVLDSRFEADSLTGINLLQHFKGWVIETEASVFDPSRFTMMDYQLVDSGTTSFMYILPFTDRKALLEYTYFSKEKVDDATYESYINRYAKDILGIDNFKILEVEQGIIPMSSHNFTKANTNQIYRIGTAGGWVKASTGYSFKNSERKAQQLVDNIIEKRALSRKMYSKKYEVFDETLLRVLHENNAIGPRVFSTMYEKNQVANILSFLDEESNSIAEIKIMKSLTSWAFVKNFFKAIF